MEWIIKPNKNYDRMKEPSRLLLFLGLIITLQIIFMLINLDFIFLLILCLGILYRGSYFWIMKNKVGSETG